MKVYRGQTFAQVYKDSLTDLYVNPEYLTYPRRFTCKENLGVTLQVEDPISCMYANSRRGSQFRYIAGELLWYFLGRNDVEYINKFSKFWKNIQNEDGTANSAYGHLIFSTKNEHGMSQYEWAIKSLIKDKDSRQAIMHFNKSEHQYFSNKDFVCTLYGIFHIRDNKLNFTVHMRSNDAILGLPTDVTFFCILQQQALNHLRENYPDLELGFYKHIDDSYHLYDRNFKLVEEMIEHEFIPVEFSKVKENFINVDGSPTENLISFNNSLYYRDPDISINDDAYEWIKNNIEKI